MYDLQLRISCTSIPGYVSANNFQASTTPAVESTRVPSMSNRLKAHEQDYGIDGKNPYIASKCNW